MAEKKATEELAVAEQVQESFLPAELEDYTGFEDIGEDAFIIPRMKIVQPTSKVGEEGNFMLNLTEEEFPELEVLVIKAQRGRIMWDESNMDKPVCRSSNYLEPDPTIENPPNAVCASREQVGSKTRIEAVCDECKWGLDGTKPACGEQYNLLCMTIADGMPFWFAVGGSSIKAVRKFISAIYMKRSKLYEFKVKLTLQKEINDKGKFYILKISDYVKMGPDELKQHLGTIVGMKDETISRTYDAEGAGGDAEGADAGVEGNADTVGDDDIPFA